MISLAVIVGLVVLLAAAIILPLAAARYLYRRLAYHRWLFWVSVVPLAGGSLAIVGFVVWTLLSGASGLLTLFLVVALFLTALAIVGHFLHIYPHRPMVYLLFAPVAVSIVLFAAPQSWLPLAILDALLAIVALADMATLPRRGVFEFGRQTGRSASLRKPHSVALTMTNRGNRAWFVWVRDGVPQELDARPDEFRLRLAPRSRANLRYQLHSSRRGAFTIGPVHVRVRSRLGLWQRLLKFDVASIIHVYPDMKQLEEYALLARTNRLSLLGVRRTRRVGLDNEFERLRDYTPDDNYKYIDWRSTARRRKLTVKDFQTNQSQRVIFLIDCGRMMTNQAGGLSLLDHAFNAMLMLSYVALSHGDSVGLMCFSDEVHSYVPPTGGMRHMNRLLHAVFDRFPKLLESRYDEAFLYLASHCRKRSLVVLVTNLIDEVNANQVGTYLRSFAGRHLPLGVLLRDRRLFDAAEEAPTTDPALFRAAAAADILTWRNQVLAELDAGGVLALDVYPEDLTAPLVNTYLEIKARHLL